MQIKSIGIDLGKTTFHLLALGDRSQGSNPQTMEKAQRAEMNGKRCFFYTLLLVLQHRDRDYTQV